MTEEIINDIDKLDGMIKIKGKCGYEIIGGCSDLRRLKQENKELKEVKEQLKKWNDENLKRQDDMQMWIDLAEEQRKNYRSALEEINITVKQLLKGVTSNCINNTPYLVALSLIENKINEVLQ